MKEVQLDLMMNGNCPDHPVCEAFRDLLMENAADIAFDGDNFAFERAIVFDALGEPVIPEEDHIAEANWPPGARDFAQERAA